jgi:hypothetical protein
MWTVFVVLGDPGVEFTLQLVECPEQRAAKHHAVKLIEDRFLESLADAIGLWPFNPRAGVLDVVHG